MPVILDTGNDNASFYDQGQTTTCWIYAMCACVEREQLLKGDSIALSRHWIIARAMEEQTLRLYMQRQGGKQIYPVGDDPREGFSMRGVGQEALRLMRLYGVVPYSHERTHINSSSVMVRKLTLLAKTAKSLQSLYDSMYEQLPRFTISNPSASTSPTKQQGKLSAVPFFSDSSRGFFYYSMRYTPLQFAESILYNQHWQFYGSVNYHKWGEKFALEIPDNQNHHEYINLPMDSLLHKTVRSLRQGHPVYWEYGKKENPTAGGVNSDHAMAIIGITKHNGQWRFICLNSYGKQWGNNGTCLISPEYFMRHTCCIGVVNE